MSTRNLFILALMLTAGNFLYQLMQAAPQWMVAAERSYFQAIALLLVWFWRAVNERHSEEVRA